jgi:hypothetical protein
MALRRPRHAPRTPSGAPIEFWRVRSSAWCRDVRALTLGLFGDGATGGDEDDQEPEENAEVVFPLGFMARPKPDESDDQDAHEAVVMRVGDEIVVLAMLNKSLATLSDEDFAAGETLVHGACTDNVTARLRIKANGDVVIYPKSGQKVYVGGTGATQPPLPGTDTHDFLSDVKTAIDALRSDVTSIMSHTHNGTAGPYPVVTLPSTTLTSIPSGDQSKPGAVPDTSGTVEIKT